MNCRVCGNELREPTEAQHARERAPLEGDICLSCWTFMVQMQLFLLRSADRTVMGNWTEGWLREILAEPTRYR